MNFNCTRLYKLQNKKILMDILKINTFIEPDTKKEVSFFSLSKNITMQQNLKKRIIKIKKVKKVLAHFLMNLQIFGCKHMMN